MAISVWLRTFHSDFGRSTARCSFLRRPVCWSSDFSLPEETSESEREEDAVENDLEELATGEDASVCAIILVADGDVTWRGGTRYLVMMIHGLGAYRYGQARARRVSILQQQQTTRACRVIIYEKERERVRRAEWGAKAGGRGGQANRRDRQSGSNWRGRVAYIRGQPKRDQALALEPCVLREKRS